MKPGGALKTLIFSLSILLVPGPVISADSDRGEITGGIAHDLPGWFKDSFLEIAEDATEAGDADRHVLLFFNLNACPYCARMLDESFREEPNKGLIQTHFDVISLNVLGDREVVFNEEITVSEKELAEILNVRATPGVMFLDANNRPVARADGYRAPESFRRILEYVSTRAYMETELSEFVERQKAMDSYALRDNPLFSEVSDLSSVSGPLMVVFEDGGCLDCNEFHDTILSDPRVEAELAPYTVVRVDAGSDTSIVDPAGNETTAGEFARAHQVIYRPGVLIFDDGELIRRLDSLVYPHHFSLSLRYVGGGYNDQMDYDAFSEQRTEELLAAGVDIDLGPPGQQ